MKVSVCIPTYNSAAYIGECLRSVLEQKGVDFEVIVFDNASEDESWKIIQSFRHPQIQAFRSEQNSGMAANFNRAVSHARGDYVKLLCSDDVLEARALELQARFLDEHRGISMVTSATRLMDSEGHPLGTVQRFSGPVVIDRLNLRAISLIYGNVIGEPSAVLFRRESWFRAGPFREAFATLIDLEMWFRLSQEGAVGYIPEPLSRIRRHARSMTSRLRRDGESQGETLRLTEESLQELRASALVRKVSLGKVAASHLRHALYGLRYGSVRWPVSALVKAIRIDPAFAGLVLYLALFRTELIGLRVDREGKSSVCPMGTLKSVSALH